MLISERNEAIVKRLPITVINIYIITTLIISFFGPMKYFNYDKLGVATYIILFLICLNMGFLLKRKSINTINKSNENEIINTYKLKRIIKLINISIYIALVSICLEFIEIIIKNPQLLSFNNMGHNYIYLRQELAGVNDYSLALLIRFMTGFFRNVTLILAPYYFKQLSKKHKVLFIIYIALLIIVNGVAYGTQKFLGDIFIYWIIIGFIKMLDLSRAKQIKIIRRSIIIVLIFVTMFSIMQIQRYDVIGVDANNFMSKSTGESYYDTNHIIFKIFGERFGFGISTIISTYMSGGYYGLSLCLKLPFKWTYGIGSSYILSLFLNRFLGIENLYESTYLNRMALQFGRDGLSSWNTIFPWLASDLTFFGALIIFIPVGYVFALTWNEILKYRNPISILLFCTVFLGLIFIPANNQLFHGIDTYISTVLIIIYWLFNHKKYNFKI